MLRILILMLFLQYSVQSLAISSDSITRILDSLELSPITNKKLSVYEELNLESEKLNFLEGQYRSQLGMGNFHFDLGYNTLAAKHFLKAYQLSEIIGDKEISAEALNSMAKVYYIIGELDEAMKHYTQVMDIGKDVGVERLEAIGAAGMAHCLNKLKRYKEAIKMLRIQKRYYTNIGDERKLRFTIYNIAYYELLDGRPKNALPVGYDYLKHFRAKKDSFEYAFGYALIGSAYTDMNKAESAIVYLDSSLVFCEQFDIRRLKLDMYQKKSEAHEQLGEMEKALVMHKEYFRLNQEIFDEQTSGNIMLFEERSLAEKQKSELMKSKLELNQMRIRAQNIYTIAGGFLAIMIIALILINKKRQDGRKSKKLAEMEKVLLESELRAKESEASQLVEKLESKNADLTNFALDIARKNEFSTELIEKLRALEKNTANNEELKEIIGFTISHLQLNKDLALLQGNVKQINNAFYKKLEALYGRLTTNEKYLAGLLRLNLSNKDIASLKGISTNSAKVGRHRLRKKLKLKAEVDIIKFLQEI